MDGDFSSWNFLVRSLFRNDVSRMALRIMSPFIQVFIWLILFVANLFNLISHLKSEVISEPLVIFTTIVLCVCSVMFFNAMFGLLNE